ncbi:hypothetical protein ASD65_13235 [Microbacterium sp. Root61]|uniref:ABC transporter transmembrane domain-containing protein n=1 Tax=Microbacterium sp. Root61 TaxID=1736570 RepID=UPI0006F91BCF|nr:ABC transporter ATP-binding protein [Microbacterium sp. Root61]KRA25276.1 hypothetical protein ASD65_13235 [Microbacterium sp. Root61]
MHREHPYPTTPWRYLWFLIRHQLSRVILGAVLGTAWMVGLTLPPLILSRAIDDGIRTGEFAKVWMWAGILLVVGLTIALLAILRHRTMTRVRLEAALQTIELTTRKSVQLGSSLGKLATTGEVATIGVGDAWTMARSLTATGPGVGAVVAYLVIAIALLRISPLLAGIIVLGMPLLMLSLGPLLNHFRARGGTYREAQGRMSGRVVDMVSGLHVLNTLGGKDLLAERWEADSDDVRRAGYRVAATESWIRGIAVGLPALFLATIVWVSARLAVQGELTIGDLVAVYGFVAVTVVPIASFIESAVDINRALVSARRTVDFLRSEAPPRGTEEVRDSAGPLIDPATDVCLRQGEFAVIATDDRVQATGILHRLAGLEPSDARWGAQRVADIDPTLLRRAVLLLDDGAFLFGGTLHDAVFSGTAPSEPHRESTTLASGMDDILRGADRGWDSELRPRGANLSGGQRQRVRLARALARDPKVMLALDPLSAVDAITEGQVAQRMYDRRRGATTLIASNSSAVLALADVVIFVDEGRVAASGSHDDLTRANPRYRSLVSRGSWGEEGE